MPGILPYYLVSNYGNIFSTNKNKFLKFSSDDGGYLSVGFRLSDGFNSYNSIKMRVNRVVLLVFEPIPNHNLYVANHINCIVTDNRLCNLNWMTTKENIQYAIYCGNFKPEIFNAGEKCSASKLTEKDVIDIANLIKSQKYYFSEIARMFNISEIAIFNIAHGKTWKYLNLDLEKDIRMSTAFTKSEIENICQFFQEADINNRAIYNSTQSLLRDCFDKLGLNEKYDLEQKRKTLVKILNKSRKSYDSITQKYDYNYIK